MGLRGSRYEEREAMPRSHPVNVAGVFGDFGTKVAEVKMSKESIPETRLVLSL